MGLLNDSHKELKKAAESGELVIFAGAGVSKSVGLPLWGELVMKIIDYINNNDTETGKTLKAIFNNKSSKNKIFDTLSIIERNNKKDFVDHVLTDEIFKKGTDIISTKTTLPVHSKLWQVSGKIITPNYDTLFESCEEFKVLNAPIISNKSILQLAHIATYSNYLLKVHGNISEIEDIVFYESQYEAQYKNETAVKNKFKELVANHPILFVGTSMTDPYINEIIQHVNSIFHNSSAKNFILSNDNFQTADIIKIPGDPITDLDTLLDELLALKSKQPYQITFNTIHKLKKLRTAIEELESTSILFPCLRDFENGIVQINVPLFNYVKSRFDNKLGPILCQGRWATGKTVSTIRIGLELETIGFNTYYFDLADEVANEERSDLLKIFQANNIKMNVFIIDNVHFIPEFTYKIAQWAIKEKCNCIFVGRPLSLEFKESKYYYSILFSQETIEGEDMIGFIDDETSIEFSKNEVYSPKIIFKPDVKYVKSIFENKLALIGRDDKIQEADIEKFADTISYNLSFITVHLSSITLKTSNIYEINYRHFYDFINIKYHLSEFPNEILMIATLSFLDCRIDCRAIFIDNEEKQKKFFNKQEHIKESRNLIYGMHSAIGRLVIETAMRSDLIRTSDNSLCYNFDNAFRFYIEKYLLNKPGNIYEIFNSLSNYEFESNETGDDNTLEETRELIYYLLTNSKLISHYSQFVIYRTNSLLKFGFFVKTFIKHKVDPHIFQNIFNKITITRLVSNFISNRKKKHGDFVVTWHFRFAWGILRKADTDLAEHYLQQFPKEALVNYASYSIGTLSSILDMAIFHPFIDELVFMHRDKIIGDSISFKEKFFASSELRIFFFLRSLNKLSLKNYKNKQLLSLVKSFVSPEEYRDYVKSLSRITLVSFKSTKRLLGREYHEVLHRSFTNDFIYQLCFDKKLFEINFIISESGWLRFLKNEFLKKLNESDISEISIFIRNVSLHGAFDIYIAELTNKLYDKPILDLIINKLLTAKIEDVFNCFWQLKTLNEKLFNFYFNIFCKQIVEDFEPLKIEITKIAVSFIYLIYFYSEELNSKGLLKADAIDVHLKKIYIGNLFADKVYMSSLSKIFDLKYTIPYNSSVEKIKGIHFSENLFQTLDEGRNRFEVYNELAFWWESKILLYTASLIGIDKIDKDILKDKRFEKNLKDYLSDVNLILNKLENDIPEHKTKNIDPVILLTLNKISILRLSIETFTPKLIF